MADQYFEGDEGFSLFRVTPDMNIYYLEWVNGRWKQDNSMVRVVSGIGGSQEIEPISKARAREILTARLNVSIARALVA